MDRGLARFTTDYMRSYENNFDATKFRSNRKIMAPVGVMKYNQELGIMVEDRNSPYDKDIHAAGVKSALMKKNADQESQFEDSHNMSI